MAPMRDNPVLHAPLFLSASGRGGSTWVQDALAQANGLGTVFEPLHPQRVPGAQRHAFRYVPDDADPADLKAFLDAALAGRANRLWTHCRINTGHLWHGSGILLSPGRIKNQYLKYRQMAHNYFHYGRRRPGPPLVKCIRAPLMVGWLHRAYGAPVLVLVRHPGAVVESKNRLASWDAAPVLARFRDDEALWRDHLHGLDLPPLDGLGRVGAFTFQWCVETLVTLRQAARHGLCVTSYEHLVAAPDREWPRAASALGLAAVPGPEILGRPSQQTSLESRARAFDDSILRRWMDRLAPKERHAMQDMLDRFGIALYRMDDPMPRPGAGLRDAPAPETPA